MSSQLRILRTYAKMHDSSIAKLPPTVYFSHTQRTLTIFDAYPKALFHFLILPRLSTTDNDVGQHDPNASSSASELTSLRTLLRRAISSPGDGDGDGNGDGDTNVANPRRAQGRTRAEETLRSLADEAARLREEIEREMRARYGFVWDLWIGFHAVPSMVHLHLHVISSDLTAPGLKTKRHYNSFSPCTSFFVPLSEVRAWFAAPQDEFVKIARLTPTEYEPRLKDALKCFRCGETLKNMPTLKNHLQEEFDVLRKQDVGKLKRKREAESASGSHAVPHRTEQAKKTARLSKSP